MSTDNKSERIEIRCTREFKKNLEKLAKAESRSISNYIECLVKEKIDEYQTKKQ